MRLNYLELVSCVSLSYIPLWAHGWDSCSGWRLDGRQYPLFTGMAGNMFFCPHFQQTIWQRYACNDVSVTILMILLKMYTALLAGGCLPCWFWGNKWPRWKAPCGKALKVAWDPERGLQPVTRKSFSQHPARERISQFCNHKKVNSANILSKLTRGSFSSWASDETVALASTLIGLWDTPEQSAQLNQPRLLIHRNRMCVALSH